MRFLAAALAVLLSSMAAYAQTHQDIGAWLQGQPAASALSGSDLLFLYQNGLDKQLSVSSLLNNVYNNVPTAPPGTNNSQAASTAFVQTATGANLTLTPNTWIGLQAFNGGSLVLTRSPGDNTTNAASTAFVQAAVTAAVPIPITGTPSTNYIPAATSPTAAAWTAPSSWFDNAYCNTVGYLIVRFTGSWTCAKAIAANPVWWGADPTGATDSSTPIQNAINSLSSTGGTLAIPGILRVNTGLTVSAPITIIGSGGGQGIYNTTCLTGLRIGAAGINLLTFNVGAAASRLDNLCIDVQGGVTHTAAAVVMAGGANGVTVDHTQINNACISVDLDGAVVAGGTINQGVVNSTIVPRNNASCIGIRIGLNGTGAQVTDAKIVNDEIYCNNAATGMIIYDSGGLYLEQNDIFACAYGTKFTPGASQQVVWTSASNTVLGDTSANNDLYINPSSASATLFGNQFASSWASSAVGGAAVFINSSTASFSGLYFDRMRIYPSANHHGIDIEAGKNISIKNGTICAEGSSTSTGDGIHYALGSNVDIQNNLIGACDTTSAVAFTNGIYIATNNVNVGVVTGNNLLGQSSNSQTAINFAYSGSGTPNLVLDKNLGVDSVLPSVASASSFAMPINPTVAVTGSSPITTITGPIWTNREVTLLPQAPLPLASGGSICSAVFLAAFSTAKAVYNGGLGCWQVLASSQLATVTIANLPSCGAAFAGALAIVSNGVASPGFLATVSTTGTTVAPVRCNATNWVYG